MKQQVISSSKQAKFWFYSYALHNISFILKKLYESSVFNVIKKKHLEIQNIIIIIVWGQYLEKYININKHIKFEKNNMVFLQ